MFVYQIDQSWEYRTISFLLLCADTYPRPRTQDLSPLLNWCWLHGTRDATDPVHVKMCQGFTKVLLRCHLFFTSLRRFYTCIICISGNLQTTTSNHQFQVRIPRLCHTFEIIPEDFRQGTVVPKNSPSVHLSGLGVEYHMVTQPSPCMGWDLTSISAPRTQRLWVVFQRPIT